MTRIISDYAVPVLVLLILTAALVKKSAPFDAFVAGGKSALAASVEIFPSLLALVVAIEVFKSSGALDAFVSWVSPLCAALGFPSEVLPLALMRPVSGSASVAITQEILKTHGADSFIGRLASVIMGSSETTFYTITLYFAATHVKKTRHSIAAALFADLLCVAAGFWVCRKLFS